MNNININMNNGTPKSLEELSQLIQDYTFEVIENDANVKLTRALIRDYLSQHFTVALTESGEDDVMQSKLIKLWNRITGESR